MNLPEIKNKTKETEKILKEIRKISLPFKNFYKNDTKKHKKTLKMEKVMQEKVKELKAGLPSGFSLNSRLERHLRWNESQDWADIYLNDIPEELKTLDEYKEKINILDAIRGLHPRVSPILSYVLRNDFDPALTIAFKSIETRIREMMQGKIKARGIRDLVKKAFAGGYIKYQKENDQSAPRDFLSGVLGLERNFFAHKSFEEEFFMKKDITVRLRFCLKKLVIASEAHSILDKCKVASPKTGLDRTKS